jgi:hypothetical protein
MVTINTNVFQRSLLSPSSGLITLRMEVKGRTQIEVFENRVLRKIF